MPIQTPPTPRPSPPPLPQQLTDAITSHNRLVALAEHSARLYHSHHGLQHEVQVYMFKLATLRVPASEAAAIKEMLRLEQAHISERMRGERERWKSVLGGVKLVKGRIVELRKMVAEERKREVEKEAEVDAETDVAVERVKVLKI